MSVAGDLESVDEYVLNKESIERKIRNKIRTREFFKNVFKNYDHKGQKQIFCEMTTWMKNELTHMCDVKADPYLILRERVVMEHFSNFENIRSGCFRRGVKKQTQAWFNKLIYDMNESELLDKLLDV